MERKRIIASAVIIFLLIPTALWSQTAEWTTYNISNSQLPFDSIGPLVFDAQGNLWIASGSLAPGSSAGGLAKFDGENWTVYYTSNSGLPCNNIHALAFDSQGNLWIGTGVPLTPGRGGLAKFNGENWTVYNTSNSGLPSNFVSSLTFDDQGNLWIGTAGGLAQFVGENWMVYKTYNSGLPYNIVWALDFDAVGNLWIGTVEPVCGSEAGGLVKFDGQNWTVYNKANSGLTSNDVWDLICDAQGNLWVGHGDDYRPAGGGLAKFDGESWTVYHTSNSPLTWHMVTSLALDSYQNLWMGMCSAHTTTGGMARFDGENWVVFNQGNSGLPHVTATGLAFDGQGSTWIGTYGGGLATLRSWPVVDFNGDGVVDSADMSIMVDYWGTNEPLCDIGPTPWGDGIVDAEDLKVLADYLFGDIRCVAHFKLDEAKGSIVNDSARNWDATVYGNPEWRPAEGIVGGALQLDGLDDYVKTGFVLNPADGALSVFAWIKGGVPGQVVVSQAGGANWLCTDTSEGNLMTKLRNPGRFGSPMLSQTNITDGNWHHIGLVWDGSKRILYIDDVAVAEDTQNGLESSDRGLYIGTGKGMEPDSFWSGLIDDVRIYDMALSEEEIAAQTQ
jgi:sugar lactone lactonase YvrE